MKILIVEDEVLIREGMSDYLMECGYEVFEAGDGQEALDIFHREAPDLVLLESSFPRWRSARRPAQRAGRALPLQA